MNSLHFDAVFSKKEDLAEECAICVKAAQTLFQVNMPIEEVPAFGLDHLRECDLAAAKSHGYICRLVSRGSKSEEGMTAYIEPCFLRPDDILASERPCLIITQDGKTHKKTELIDSFQSYCVDAEPTENNNTIEIHPYYIRTTCTDNLWYSVVAEEVWGEGILTKPVSVKAMHNWAEHALKEDAELFYAAVL